MATMARQPFAPLDGARLQTLTSLKNRQNALPPAASTKRKASDSVESDDFENIDPVLFSKRPKGTDSFFAKDSLKSSSFVLTKAAPTLSVAGDAVLSSASPAKTSLSRPRSYLLPKSPAAKLNTNIAKAPLSAPAGRSPTRGSKRAGLLSSRRRTGSPFTRVEPPAFNLGGAAPFSLDAALKGTIPSYTSRPSLTPAPATLDDSSLKSSWFFDIHEDSPEQEMTNLLQHSTCVLDISSDEESEQKARREKAEGRDKENIPPADDVSQTSRAARNTGSIDEMVVDKARDPLSQLNAADFYAAGCDEASVIIIPGDEVEESGAPAEDDAAPTFEFASEFAPEFAPELAPELKVAAGPSVEELMGDRDEPAAKAAVLEPIEGTGESFDLWESGSAKDEAEPISAPSPPPAAESVATDAASNNEI